MNGKSIVRYKKRYSKYLYASVSSQCEDQASPATTATVVYTVSQFHQRGSHQGHALLPLIPQTDHVFSFLNKVFTQNFKKLSILTLLEKYTYCYRSTAVDIRCGNVKCWFEGVCACPFLFWICFDRFVKFLKDISCSLVMIACEGHVMHF